MALQSDAIASRLEGLKVDDRRKVFDSQIRAIRMDSKITPELGARAVKPPAKPSSEETIDQVVLLLEELSRRIDGLEKKDRALADEIRQRAKADRKRRSITMGGGAAVAGLAFLGWMLRWF